MVSSSRWLTCQGSHDVLTRQPVSCRDVAGALHGATLPFGVRRLDGDPVAVLAQAVLLDEIDTESQVFHVLTVNERARNDTQREQ